MRLFVALTDWDWFAFLRGRPELDEVNFWFPSAETGFHALGSGEPFLFKLHSPRLRIAGMAWFQGFCRLPLIGAWATFGEANGAASLPELAERMTRYRRARVVPEQDEVGCVLLRDPVFFPDDDWLPEPSDWARNIVRGKGYDASTGVGRALWESLEERLRPASAELSYRLGPAAGPVQFSEGVARRRLGQRAFRALVTDVYERRCTVTGERVLPVLQACHIRPATREGPHDIRNGLLLRSDLHTLFDLGYIGVDPPTHRLLVSRELRDGWENGRDYYALAGRELRPPRHLAERPAREFLEWHREALFRG
ncbi:MAG TPA: HNH endonuclease [Candidatus Dormibacteraeota bacterium]|nr:HNH endonuclease [Candidatus Dormibacteraeota bacterium]